MLESISNWIQDKSVQRVLILLVLILAILIANNILKKVLTNKIKENSFKYKTRKAMNFIAYLAMIIVILFTYNDRLGNIGVALGVAGAGIAFALQEVIISIAGWLSIVLSGSLNVGQRVKIGEVKGDIIDIGIFTTTIMEIGDWVDGDLYNGRIVSIANSFVFKEKIHNYSAEYPFLWDEIKIPIRNESDFTIARKVFTDVLNEVCHDYTIASKAKWKNLEKIFRVEEAQVEPMVTMAFDENWITFTLRYIVDYKKRRSTKDLIYTRLLNEINKYDDIIMIATSSMEVTNITPPSAPKK